MGSKVGSYFMKGWYPSLTKWGKQDQDVPAEKWPLPAF